MLCLQIGLPGGRYHAADHADPRQPEWPPHPSRVLSALVAAAYAGGHQPAEAERQALQTLEAASEPSMTFPQADVRPAPDSYVPVNDRKSRIEARKGQSFGVLMPNRQVRQFPSAFLLGPPEIAYRWPLEVPDRIFQALDALAGRMTHLGTSHTFVTARFLRDNDGDAGSCSPRQPPTLVPDPTGTIFLRVPRAGRLDELDRLARQGHGTLRRPPPACESLAAFRAPGPQTPDEGTVASGALDWVALSLAGATWGADTAHTLARAFRAAVMGLLGDDAPACIHGHDPAAPHAAWLPLPDVGHDHARGRLRGLAVALPAGLPPQERALALAGLARLRQVHLPDGQVAHVAPVIEGPDTLVALRGQTWRGPHTDWSTVTPVLLDRPPKRHRPNALEAAMRESMQMAGFPPALKVALSSLSDFTGAPGVHELPTRVPRFHVRLRFAQPVQGPVLAGRWRHFGVGLFRPTPLELRWP